MYLPLFCMDKNAVVLHFSTIVTQCIDISCKSVIISTVYGELARQTTGDFFEDIHETVSGPLQRGQCAFTTMSMC